ncbi:MAG: peroxiredoxin [Bacteroidia bacterium]|jgi:peroxiredoxin
MRLILSVFFMLNVLGMNAQTAPDFTITDIDGNSHNLYSTLDEGKVVVLKFFTNWCGICNNTADNVQALYDTYQSNGDPVEFWALDRDANETNVHATTYRNNNNLTFPVIGEANWVANLYGVQYQPEYKIICTDRSYEEEITYTQVNQHVLDCLSQITGIEESSTAGELNIRQTGKGVSMIWEAENTQTSNLSIIDAAGRVVLTQTITGGKRVHLNLTNGIYVHVLALDSDNIIKGKFAVAK